MSGGSGNLVTIRHSGGLQTQYLHLSKILVRAGQKVDQGTRIGLVGMTGLASGPHLDIRISKNGSYLNWEEMRAPRSVALEGELRQSFMAERDRMLAALNITPTEVVAAPEMSAATAAKVEVTAEPVAEATAAGTPLGMQSEEPSASEKSLAEPALVAEADKVADDDQVSAQPTELAAASNGVGQEKTAETVVTPA